MPSLVRPWTQPSFAAGQTVTLVAQHTLPSLAVTCTPSARLQPFTKGLAIPSSTLERVKAEPRAPGEQVCAAPSPDHLVSLPTLGPPITRPVSRNPSSMSIRRLASNRPVLHCKVDLPPVPSFPSGSLRGNTPTVTPSLTPGQAASPFPLSLRQFTLAHSKTRNANASPITPIDQIMPRAPLSPPPLQVRPLALSRPHTRKLHLAAPLKLALHSDFIADSPPRTPVLGLGLEFAGTPYAAELAPPSPFLLDGPPGARSSLSPLASPIAPSMATTTNGCDTPSPQRDVSPPDPTKRRQSTTGSCAGAVSLHARARPPLRLSLPRRLSYNRSGFASSPGNGAATPTAIDEGLASPAVIGPQCGPGLTGMPKPGRPKSLVTKANHPGTPGVYAHLPRMVELGSYF